MEIKQKITLLNISVIKELLNRENYPKEEVIKLTRFKLKVNEITNYYVVY